VFQLLTHQSYLKERPICVRMYIACDLILKFAVVIFQLCELQDLVVDICIDSVRNLVRIQFKTELHSTAIEPQSLLNITSVATRHKPFDARGQ
jgi:hypothetical protein